MSGLPGVPRQSEPQFNHRVRRASRCIPAAWVSADERDESRDFDTQAKLAPRPMVPKGASGAEGHDATAFDTWIVEEVSHSSDDQGSVPTQWEIQEQMEFFLHDAYAPNTDGGHCGDCNSARRLREHGSYPDRRSGKSSPAQEIDLITDAQRPTH